MLPFGLQMHSMGRSITNSFRTEGFREHCIRYDDTLILSTFVL